MVLKMLIVLMFVIIRVVGVDIYVRMLVVIKSFVFVLIKG